MAQMTDEEIKKLTKLLADEKYSEAGELLRQKQIEAGENVDEDGEPYAKPLRDPNDFSDIAKLRERYNPNRQNPNRAPIFG